MSTSKTTTKPSVEAVAAVTGIAAAAQKQAEALAGDTFRIREMRREEAERDRKKYDERIDRIEAIAETANDAIAAAEAGDARRAAELIEDVYGRVHHECNHDCASCPMRDEVLNDFAFRGASRCRTKAGSLCAFARAVTGPMLRVRACQYAVSEAMSMLGRAQHEEGKAREALADAEHNRQLMQDHLAGEHADLTEAKAKWAEVCARYK